MDAYEATKIVFSRIQNLDPENASKVMGLLLIQDHGEKEMIRLAFGPETLLHSVILKTKKDLILPPKSPSSPSPSPFHLSSNPTAISRANSASSRLGISIPPSSSTSTTWSTALSELQSSEDLISSNYLPFGSSSSTNSSSLPFYGSIGADLIDELQIQDQLSFLNNGSPTLGTKHPDLFYSQSDLSSSPAGGGGSDALLFSSYAGAANFGGSLHRRSCSVSDAFLGSDDPSCGFGWKPCLYYARGYCKNGASCRFLHGGLVDSASSTVGSDGGSGAVVGSPTTVDMMDQCHEQLLRSKSAQQRLTSASQLMASANAFPYSPKTLNLLLQQQQADSPRGTGGLVMGEDMNSYGRLRLERNDLSLVSPASRQIYLTFPADSTFREEDVSNYFSIYGPVQDVRIPYQQKRMFGFVTFMYPETVKLILAKGNPHFVCDARVLVKPYKEKGKVPDKYRKLQQQQLERGDFSPCGTPTGMDCNRDPFENLQLGSRMFYNSQDMLWKRKLEEQADLQQALDLQSQRLMNLQLLDIKKHHRAFSTGSPIPSPTLSPSPNPFSGNLVFPSIPRTPETRQENATSGIELAANCGDVSDKEDSPHLEDGVFSGSLEHNLPDSPFASPTKAAREYTASTFSNSSGESSDQSDANSIICSGASSVVSMTLDTASFKSFNYQMPRYSSGHGTIGMYPGTGGPTCPVGI